MKQFELVAESRTDVGKGASRRLRRTGKIPGIVYGSDSESAMITMQQNELIHQLENEAFYSHILDLTIDGKNEQVVIKDLQRHAYKPEVLHIDFQRVNAKEKLTMHVPLHYMNEEKCAGVKEGGVVSHLMTDLEIQCLPKDLPEFIELDMLEVELGSTIHLGDLKLPEGVEIYALTHGGDVGLTVASVHLPKIEIEPEEDEEEVSAAGPAAEDEEEEGGEDSAE